MKVYIVCFHECEDTAVKGVYATEGDAEQRVKELMPVPTQFMGSAWHEEHEVVEAPKQYIEYCQLDYRVDCRKPNLGGPESHIRTVANVNDVDVVDGRVRRKPVGDRMTEMVTAVLNGEYEIVLPKHRADRPEWYTETGWERTRLAALRDTIQNLTNPVVYYVGAEEGEMAALCQMWGAYVVLFEPNPAVWPNIRAIWEANNLTPPRCFVGFASNVTDLEPPHGEPRREGTGDLWPECAYGPIIGDHGFKELYQEADAFPQFRIDDLKTAGVAPPTIITFDVEGSEWQVLRGAEQTLREHRPVLLASIHPEFMFHQWGEYSRDFRNWIIDLGYTETILDYQHELHALYEPRPA